MPPAPTPEHLAACASCGAVLARFAEAVLKAESWVGVAVAVLDRDQQPGAPADFAPLDLSGVDDGGEVDSLYVHPNKMRRWPAGKLRPHALARSNSRCLACVETWATPFSLPVFQRAGFVLVERF